MAIGGRKPKPTAQKIATGNPGRRPLPKNEARFAVGALNAPAWFDLHEREEWERIVPELQANGIAKGVHQGDLEGICVLYGRFRDAREEGDAKEMRLSFDAYRKARNEFGLTPASAARVPAITEDGDTDPAEEFFKGPRLAG